MADGREADEQPGQWWGEDTERITTMVPEGFKEELAAAYPESRSETEAAWLAMFDAVGSKTDDD